MERPGASRRWAWAGAAVLLVAVATGTSSVQAGRRIGAVGALCPADAPTKEIDEDGVKDVCVARAPETCAANRRLVQDAKGESDRCVAVGAATTAAGEKPSCGAGFDLKVRAGADSCERRAKPICAEGFHLSPRAKEDHCEH
jgi:hypothetical protein